MKEEEILEKLESFMGEIGIDIRYEKGDFSGGMYRYNTMRQIIINKALETRQRIAIIVKELNSNVDLDSLYIVPALREVIEHANNLE
ncbi:MAG: hypothetical protein ACE5IR_07285 [bacterium]